MRILFLCDLHGSEILLNKAILATSSYDIDLLILSGDIAGKDIRPIIKNKDKYILEYEGEKQTFTQKEVENIKVKLCGLGHYYFDISLDDYRILEKDKIFKILDNKILERVDNWLNKVISLIDLQRTSVIITPGNDDILGIDELIKKAETNGLHYGLKGPIKIEDFEIVSLDYTNHTPWKTMREMSEEELEIAIKERIENVKDFDNTIFNFHCPPYNTKLDIAPEVDDNLRFVINPGRGFHYIHVGSISILNSIRKYQPLLSLHGHIHESQGFDYIGKTLSLNPGSEFNKGILNAYIIEISKGGIINNFSLIDE